LRVAIISINKPSFDSALELAEKMRDFDVEIFMKDGFHNKNYKISSYKSLDEALSYSWKNFDAIISIIAIGALIRKIAPLLKDKSKDPAVLAVNLKLNRIVPLIGGHLAGANKLSNILAQRLNAIEFITTATDQTKTISFDLVAKERDWRIENLKMLAGISNRLLNGESVKVITTEKIFNSLPKSSNLRFISLNNIDEVDKNSVVIAPFGDFEALTLRPKIYIGIGCKRGIDQESLKRAFDRFLYENRVSVSDIKLFSSFEVKRSEKALLSFVENLNREIKFFNKNEINSVFYDFKESASEKFFGLKGVSEPTALLASEYKELIFRKKSFFNQVSVAGAI